MIRNRGRDGVNTSEMEQATRAVIESLVLIKCPRCSKLVPKSMVVDVRGEIACSKCQIERLWDYEEENRRSIKRIIELSNTIDWEGKSKG
jgi:hypothetical protein